MDFLKQLGITLLASIIMAILTFMFSNMGLPEIIFFILWLSMNTGFAIWIVHTQLGKRIKREAKEEFKSELENVLSDLKRELKEEIRAEFKTRLEDATRFSRVKLKPSETPEEKIRDLNVHILALEKALKP